MVAPASAASQQRGGAQRPPHLPGRRPACKRLRRLSGERQRTTFRSPYGPSPDLIWLHTPTHDPRRLTYPTIFPGVRPRERGPHSNQTNHRHGVALAYSGNGGCGPATGVHPVINPGSSSVGASNSDRDEGQRLTYAQGTSCESDAKLHRRDSACATAGEPPPPTPGRLCLTSGIPERGGGASRPLTRGS